MKALTTSLCALIAAVALPSAALADHHRESRGGGRDSRGGHDYRGDSHGRYDHGSYDRGRYGRGGRFYYSRGYYGPYYGYYPRTYIGFYSSPAYYYDEGPRDTVYYGNPAYYSRSVSSDVQRELKRRGFYHGSIDGVVGPASRAAIRSYQVDRGFRVTSTIDSRLLDSLGLD